MRKVLLCCGKLSQLEEVYDEVWSLGVLAKRRLELQGVPSQNLFDLTLEDLDMDLRIRIEAGLKAEAASSKALAWAEIAYQHVHWRFVRYYQYRLRIEQLIDEKQVSHLTVSSQADGDLTHACVAACDTRGISLDFLNGKCDRPSSLLSFLAAYDLPNNVSALEVLIMPLLALYYRLKGVRVFYQPYNNLADGYPDAAALTWRRSVCFPGFSLPEDRLSGLRSLLNLRTSIRSNHAAIFNPALWFGFDAYDLDVLSSAFSYFQQRYESIKLDRLYACCRRFFSWSGAQRMVLNSDNTCTTRLLSKAARVEGLQVDYLPHGLIIEDLSLKTKSDCGVDRVLSWNAASAAAYGQRGSLAVAITHPANVGEVMRKRALPPDLATLRVLILPPEWVGLSFVSRPDCFERDLLDIMEALSELGIIKAQVKCHNSVKAVLDAKLAMLDAIRPYASIDFDVLDSHVSTQQLYERFDLVIIGPTTGLLEASRSSTPFVGFRVLKEKAGLLDGFQLPTANSVSELISVIQNYSVDSVDRDCIRINASLTAGELPFSKRLDLSHT